MADPVLRAAKWAFLILIVFLLLDVVWSVFGILPYFLNVIMGIGTLAGTIFIAGFYRIGQSFKLRFLQAISGIIILLAIAMSLVIFSGKFQDILSMRITISSFITFGLVIFLLGNGILCALFGISLLPLKKQFGKIVIATSVVDIIAGLLLGGPIILSLSRVITTKLIPAIFYAGYGIVILGLILAAIIIFKADVASNTVPVTAYALKKPKKRLRQKKTRKKR